MVITANSGPNISFGLTRSASGQVQEYNEERGPDIADCGNMIGDPRGVYGYQPGSGVGANVYGWYNGVGTIDCVPTTISTNAVALTQSSTTTGATIVLSSVSNGNVTIGVTLTPADGSSARTVIAIDSTYSTFPRGLEFGQVGTVTAWDATTLLGRNVTIAKGSSLDDTAGTYTIQGFDIYGNKMTETITGTSSQGSSNYTSRKMFKFIQSITVGGTPGSSTISVGVGDTYGFPLAVHDGSQVNVWSGLSSNGNWLSAQSSLMVFASTVTQTATTPDVRGSWASSIASSTANGQRVKIVVTPRVQDVQVMTTTYASSGPHMWLGVDQYSS